jgi:hypothetical protein
MEKALATKEQLSIFNYSYRFVAVGSSVTLLSDIDQPLVFPSSLLLSKMWHLHSAISVEASKSCIEA